MKKIVCVMLALVFAVCLAGCGKSVSVKQSALLSGGKVKTITVSSQPASVNIALAASEKAQAIADYFSGLTLTEDFSEDPDTYSGTTWIVRFAYTDGKTETLYHFGNLFVRSEAGPWYKMNPEEAARFEALLH